MWHKITYDHTNLSVPMGFNNAFPLAFIAANQSLEFAVFIRKEQNGRSSTLYFSPAATALAMTNPNVTPCDKPSPDGIEFFAGERASLALFFPEL